MPKKVHETNKARDSWRTPAWLYDALNSQYRFVGDLAACDRSAKCFDFYSEQRSFLKASRKDFAPGIYFMNPPFSKALDFFNHVANLNIPAVCIYRADNMETKVWQEVIFPNACFIHIPSKRVQYDAPPGVEGSTSVMFPSAIICFGVTPPTNVEGHYLEVGLL